MISMSTSRSAPRKPAYMRFLSRMRERTPWNVSLHMRANGAPRMVMSSRLSRAGPRRVVDQVAAGADFLDVFRVRLGVHRDHDVDPAGAGDITVARHADLVPGRQALNVRREVVLPDHRNAHPEDGLHQQRVRARRAGAVYIRELDDEVVQAVLRVCCVEHGGVSSLA